MFAWLRPDRSVVYGPIDAEDRFGRTALCLAVQYGSMHTSKLLVDEGASALAGSRYIIESKGHAKKRRKSFQFLNKTNVQVAAMSDSARSAVKEARTSIEDKLHHYGGESGEESMDMRKVVSDMNTDPALIHACLTIGVIVSDRLKLSVILRSGCNININIDANND